MSIAQNARQANPVLTEHTTAQAIGKWVAVGTCGDAAIVIKIGSRPDVVLVRYATRAGGYHWVDACRCVRREDWDRRPDPKWLADARVSTRPPLLLWWVLNPHVIPENTSLDPVTYRDVEAHLTGGGER